MSIRSILQDHGLLNHVVLSGELDTLLSSLTPTAPPDELTPGIFTGEVEIDLDQNKSPLPGFDFQLGLPTDQAGSVPFKLKIEPTAFWFWLILSKDDRIYAVFKFVEKLPGVALTGATVERDLATGEASLVSLEKPAVLVSKSNEAASQLAPSLLIFGTASKPASMHFTPDTSPDSVEGVLVVGFQSEAVVFGGSKIGFSCPQFVLDDSETAKAPGTGISSVIPALPHIKADEVGWRGFLAREVDFYLPKDTPFFGGQPIKGYFAIPTGTGGIELLIATEVPAKPAMGGSSAKPAFRIRIECIDPTARGLTGLVPTLISASLELPLKADAPSTVAGVEFLGGAPVVTTATFARDTVNDPEVIKVALGMSAQGDKGIVSVTSTNGAVASKAFNIGAAMATSLIASGAVPQNGDGKSILALIAAAGETLSALFEPESQFVLHGVEIASSGHGLPAGAKVSMSLDYSVSMIVTSLRVPGDSLSVSMVPDQPMRIRVRRVTMTMDMTKSGLDMFDLDFDKAELEIENPGAWQLDGFEQLFDVIGSRSGRGSEWIEVDLRFKLNLGPIRVSGLTIRATLQGATPVVSITGVEVGLELPGLVDGHGALHLVEGGFEANLAVSIVPIEFIADATVLYAAANDERPEMVFLALSADLPAAIPLANTGLGLFAVEGMFGVSVVPNYGAVDDPILRQLQWEHREFDDFTASAGNLLFGLGAVVGTLPDLGFTFSAKAELVITAPDISVRGALNGTVMQPRSNITAPSHPPQPGVSFIGFVGVSSKAVDFAVIGSVILKPLLEIRVPIAGHYPIEVDVSDWYTYLGADGFKGQGRELGPISAKVLPDILGIEADAYLMTRGKGITRWPVSAPFIDLPDGFVIAFGFAVHGQFGFRPVAWAEIFVSLDLLMVPDPLTFAGLGKAHGSLHLGPFSLGVSAVAKFLATEDVVYLWVEVTGRVELLFFDIEATVTITFGDKEPAPILPPPGIHPLERYELVQTDQGPKRRKVGVVGALTDDNYTNIQFLTEDPAEAENHRVWPDVLISIPFAFPVDVTVDPVACQFSGVKGHGEPHVASPIGSELLKYRWQLTNISLFDVTEDNDRLNGGTLVDKPLVARWQVPRGADNATELMLFTRAGDIWVNRRADEGKNIGDPISSEANICSFVAEAKPGWAIGHLGRRRKEGYLLPQSPISLDPLATRIEVELHHFGLAESGFETLLDNAFNVPHAYGLEPGRVRSFTAWPDVPDNLGLDRSFEGALVAPYLTKPRNLNIHDRFGDQNVEPEIWEFFWQRLHLDLHHPLSQGILILVASRELFENLDGENGIRVMDSTGSEWRNPELNGFGDDELIAIYRQPEGRRSFDQVVVTWPIGDKISVVGLRAISDRATEMASIQMGAAAELADKKANILINLPINIGEQRTILDPGHLYRIEIDTTWIGDRFEAGNISTPVQTDTGNARHNLFFATAECEIAPLLLYGQKGFASFIYRAQKVFQPEMLERYLAGYEPAQSEQFRFCADPISAHYHQSHVQALASAYGFTLTTALRRIDRPGDEHIKPILILPIWDFGTNRKFMTAVNQARFDAVFASACQQPTPGATATITPLLAPEAWYEVYASADIDGQSHGRLRGVTFKTSRWSAPTDMLQSLGFSVNGAGPLPLLSGDLAVKSIIISGGTVILDDDLAFQNAMQELGISNWPVATAPRQSRIWKLGGANGWQLVGFLLESPEPIHRAGRLDYGPRSLVLSTGQGFDVFRRDRSGSRMLFLTTQPFDVGPAASLSLTSSQGLTGVVGLPPTPAFSEDP